MQVCHKDLWMLLQYTCGGDENIPHCTWHRLVQDVWSETFSVLRGNLIDFSLIVEENAEKTSWQMWFYPIKRVQLDEKSEK